MATAIETLFNDRKLIVYPETGELKLINLTEATVEVAFLSREGAYSLIKALVDYALAPLSHATERDALIAALTGHYFCPMDEGGDCGSHIWIEHHEARKIADVLIAADFRRAEQTEPTDAQVLAALNGHKEADWRLARCKSTPSPSHSLGDWDEAQVIKMRAALKAAFTAGQEEQP